MCWGEGTPLRVLPSTKFFLNLEVSRTFEVGLKHRVYNLDLKHSKVWGSLDPGFWFRPRSWIQELLNRKAQLGHLVHSLYVQNCSLVWARYPAGINWCSDVEIDGFNQVWTWPSASWTGLFCPRRSQMIRLPLLSLRDCSPGLNGSRYSEFSKHA